MPINYTYSFKPEQKKFTNMTIHDSQERLQE